MMKIDALPKLQKLRIQQQFLRQHSSHTHCLIVGLLSSPLTERNLKRVSIVDLDGLLSKLDTVAWRRPRSVCFKLFASRASRNALPIAVGVLTSTMIPLVIYGDSVHYIPYEVY